jgi:hypothetical protein
MRIERMIGIESSPSPSSRLEKSWTKLSLILIVIALVCWSASIFLPIQNILGYLEDDTFYYLQIADHIAMGQGSTFDGLNPTNGYHPLWLIICTAVRFVFQSASKLMYLRVIFVVQMLISLVALWVLWKLLRSVFSLIPTLLSMLLFTSGMFRLITGLETALLVACIVIACWVILKDYHPLVVGFCLALIFLSRLDYGLVSLTLGIAWLWLARKRTQFWRDAAIVAGVPLLIMALYMLINQLVFGIPLPVSFFLKTGHVISFSPRISADYLSRALFFVIVLAYYAASVLLRSESRTQAIAGGRMGAVLAGLASGIVLHLSYLELTVQWGETGWHVIPYGIVFTMFLSALLEITLHSTTFQRYSTFLAASAMAGLVIFNLATNLRVMALMLNPPPNSLMINLYEAAIWLRENTDSSAVGAMRDAGAIGYFSERRIVNLDGLVNSYDTHVMLREGLLCELMEQWGVDYIMSLHDDISAPYTTGVNATSARGTGKEIHLTDQQELYRSREARQFMVFIWDYQSAECVDQAP